MSPPTTATHPWPPPAVGITGPAPAAGIVSLVGAGPGDPELITVRGLSRLRHAEVVVYDRLVHPALLDEAPAEAERVDVGKAPGRRGWSQEEIQALLVSLARDGKRVVRLKGGDPFVFGRGGEEAAACAAAGVPWEVVPGVTSAVAAPAAAAIPLTHRGTAASVAVLTGHGRDGSTPDHDWAAVARLDTVVVLMGVARLGEVTAALIAHGRAPDTPAAIVERATLADQRVVRCRLAELPSEALAAGVRSPATVVVGEVAALAAELAPRAPDAEPAPVLAALPS